MPADDEELGLGDPLHPKPSLVARIYSSRLGRAVLSGVLIAVAVLIFSGVQDAIAESSRTLCVTNERRISSALLLYCQDHDGRLPPPEYRISVDEWRNWFGLLHSYLPQGERLVCPKLDVGGARSPAGYSVDTSYALNDRFFGRFAPGPFPLENLELPAETALLVEAGSWLHPSRGAKTVSPSYFDIANSREMFPAPHGQRMNIAAADGHVVSVKPVHYRAEGHDGLFGRIGGTIYNWNGGHPNGDTAGPPRE